MASAYLVLRTFVITYYWQSSMVDQLTHHLNFLGIVKYIYIHIHIQSILMPIAVVGFSFADVGGKRR